MRKRDRRRRGSVTFIREAIDADRKCILVSNQDVEHDLTASTVRSSAM